MSDVLIEASNARVDRAALVEKSGGRPRRPWTIVPYDTKRFPFAALLTRDVFKAHRLDRLHLYLQDHRRKHGGRTRLRSKDNEIVRAMMQDQPADAAFWKLYHHFMLARLAPWVGKGISYTSNPKMRIHLPGTGSVSSFHHDICVTKRIDQINFWMPFNDVSDGATLWLESDYGRKDYEPVEVRYGEVLFFDGGYLGHGSTHNNTDTTRVSLDMRFSYKKATTRRQGIDLMNRMIDVSASAFATDDTDTQTDTHQRKPSTDDTTGIDNTSTGVHP